METGRVETERKATARKSQKGRERTRNKESASYEKILKVSGKRGGLPLGHKVYKNSIRKKTNTECTEFEAHERRGENNGKRENKGLKSTTREKRFFEVKSKREKPCVEAEKGRNEGSWRRK